MEKFTLLGQLAWKNDEFVEAEIRFQRAQKDPDQEVQALVEYARMLVLYQKYQKLLISKKPKR